MSTQNESRRPADVLLLSMWVYGYLLLIKAFGVLQRVEKLFASSR